MRVLARLVLLPYRLARRALFACAIERDRGAVVFAGDSLIAQWRTLPRSFPLLRTANRGINGDTTAGLLSRLEKDVLSGRPRAVVALIGTNDLTYGESPEAVADRVAALLEKCARAAAPVVLCGLLPRARKPGIFPEKILALNGLLASRAAGRPGVVFCDAFPELADERGGLKEALSTDGLHLNAAGYAALARALAPALAGLVQ